MNIKKVLSIIDTLREGWYDPPSNYYQKKEEFQYRSYAHSAMDELKFYLMEHENENPITAIEEFRHKMDDFSCEAKNENISIMFSVYYDVSTDVLDALLSVK